MPSESTHPVNAAFFGLALTAALNPKPLGADLLIIENHRPRAMFICFMAGGPRDVLKELVVEPGRHQTDDRQISRGVHLDACKPGILAVRE